MIQKAGEIIPQVVRVEAAARQGTETSFVFPKVCPSCGAPVERSGDEVDFYCSNPPSRCPDQLKEWLRWYAHRDAMDVDGLGEKLIDQLVQKKMVRSLADLYRLDAPTLSELDRMGKKSAENLVRALEESKHRTLDRLLTGLTIRHVGTRMAEIIAARVKTLDQIRHDARRIRVDPRSRPDRRREYPRVLSGPRQQGSARRSDRRGREPGASPAAEDCWR